MKPSASGVAVLRLVPLVVVVGAALVVAAGSRSPVRLAPELSWAAPSSAFPLGCGDAGVDLLAVVAHATLRGIALAASVAAIGFVIGCPLGAAAGLFRGRFERVVARACDLVQAFPTFLLALVVLSAVRSPSRVHLGVVFAITAWAPFTRLALAQTRVLRDAAFVEAARALGGGNVRVVALHLVPNLLGVVAVQLGAAAAAIVVSEAALSFVGFGTPDGVSLGSVLDQGVAAMLRAPHVLLVGAASVFAASVSLMIAGRAFDRRASRQ
ncbi:Dipeptide transport system permease protein DppC [Labilithrix luteola]|uniref:Dipeptide transport system permease protein DppC n=1 Tax=Labilithrix luteola TaxID=1391654 RepID=A0A0K1Q5D8_9BACT|nr:ABC transporter permease [Labilithrix luteola]AKV00948.1 Dipeptide transport system permease protein DppC [Labilithrix luteola]